jgi:hypothetical protein
VPESATPGEKGSPRGRVKSAFASRTRARRRSGPGRDARPPQLGSCQSAGCPARRIGFRSIVAFVIFVGLGAVVGFVTGRWWMLLVVPPATLLFVGLIDSVLESDLHWWIALVESAFSALGISLGVLARRFAN